MTNRNYSTPGGTPPNYQATPNVTYTYDDPLIANSKGKLTKVASGISTTEYTSFDILGRVAAHKQTTDGQAYTTGYVYNLSGALIEETYPSGRVVKNVLDNNGDLSFVQSKKNATSGYWNYAKNFTYNAAGAVTSMQLGNGRWESTQFNSRLQPTQIALGTVQNGTDKLKLDYTYGTINNNGNVLSQKITVKRPNQSDLVFDQTYSYDSLNRITSAEEKTGTTTNWNQTYTFDRYGNRNFNEALTTTLPKNCGTSPNFVVCTADIPVFNPSVNTGNNRLNGTTYDAAGNVIVDAEGRQFTYDAENKQIEVENSSEVVIGTYFFDGDGKRVKKIVPSTGEITIFVYDAGGKLVAEYSTIVEPVETANVQYLTNDHLGSPRINTNKDGNVTSRTDYMPYGEEIIALGDRSSSDKYVVDTVRQGFTGYERDNETDLDFAQARYYAKNHGRFNSPDPARMLRARMADPQHWNLYVYARNNPVILVDITGEFPTFSFSLHVRAFAPFDWFGPGRIAKGDNRGFSTDPNATYRISSRTEITADGSQNMKYDLATTYVDRPTTSTTSLTAFHTWSAQSPSHLSDGDVQSDNGLSQPTDSMSAHNYGNDRAIPGSSDIDLVSKFNWNYKEQKDGWVNLTITGTVTGDQFPAAEAFVRDSKGNGVFLGVFATPPGSGPVTSLPGNNRLPMINANVTVQVRNGVFTGVIENGKVVSLDEYNKRFRDQPAAR